MFPHKPLISIREVKRMREPAQVILSRVQAQPRFLRKRQQKPKGKKQKFCHLDFARLRTPP
jgi:hypothetical protein